MAIAACPCRPYAEMKGMGPTHTFPWARPPWGHSPGCVAAVCEGQIPHAQVVERPQDAQAAVDGVAALHADQTGHLALLEGLSDACEQSPAKWWASGWQVCPSLWLNPVEGQAAPSPRLGTRAGVGGAQGGGPGPTFAAGDTQEGLRVHLAHAVDDVDLLQRPLHGIFVLGVAGCVRRPELGATGTGTKTSGPRPTPHTYK